MKTLKRAAKAGMSADAYAGFLKLLLTPGSRALPLSDDVRAYLEYVNEQEPLSETARRAIGQPTDQAA